jgi:hypothetical protein
MPQLRVAIGLAVSLGICVSIAGCGASSEQKRAAESFQTYAMHYLDGYNANRTARVTLLDGGWAKEYFEADVRSTRLQIEPSDSETSPYIGKLDFQMICHFTAFHHTREDALGDNSFINTNTSKLTRNYAYQNGVWIPLDNQDTDSETRQ